MGTHATARLSIAFRMNRKAENVPTVLWWHQFIEGQLHFLENRGEEACEVAREFLSDCLDVDEVHRRVTRDRVHRLYQLYACCQLGGELQSAMDERGAVGRQAD